MSGSQYGAGEIGGELPGRGGLDPEHPRLFVYIPTYNRPESLRRQLTAITSQRAGWPGGVRILVSDNASPLTSTEDLASISSEFDVVVRRNGSNIGANANIAMGFVFARDDEFMWILSDNDTVAPGAVEFIVKNGLDESSDAITFSTQVGSSMDFVHKWESAWDGAGEIGLISNVVYRCSVFLPYAAQAFFYHNTSFPHLAVILSALRERGALHYRVLPSEELFMPEVPHGEQAGDYSLSLSGMPQLLPLLPAPQAHKFARTWLSRHGSDFFRYRHAHPSTHASTRACLKSFGGIRARLLLMLVALRYVALGWAGPAVRQLGRRVLPQRIHRLFR